MAIRVDLKANLRAGQKVAMVLDALRQRVSPPRYLHRVGRTALGTPALLYAPHGGRHAGSFHQQACPVGRMTQRASSHTTSQGDQTCTKPPSSMALKSAFFICSEYASVAMATP